MGRKPTEGGSPEADPPPDSEGKGPAQNTGWRVALTLWVILFALTMLWEVGEFLWKAIRGLFRAGS